MPDQKTDLNTSITDATRSQLRAFVQRIERLEEDKLTIMEDMKEVYAEAKANGYDVKILKQVIRLRKIDRADRQEQEALLELYLDAIGEH